jgi:putative flippase GtrA
MPGSQAFNGGEAVVQRSTISTIGAGAAVAEATHSETGPRQNVDYLPLTLSIIVPTRNEAGNIEALVRRLEDAFGDTAFEIIFVDDSSDNTPEAIMAVQAQARCPIQLIARAPHERSGGLGGAVVAGMRRSRAAWVCVMDADLQHPPEMAPQMLARALRGDVNAVVASRYVASGEARSGLNYLRSLVSQGSTLAARVLFPRNLRNVSDPMSGFFLVQRSVLNLDAFQPRGFKILLEILVRTPRLRIAEVGFVFGKRLAGESKASFQEGVRYMNHLCRLRISSLPATFIKFVLVGLSGLLVNSLALALATDLFSIYYLLSAVIATQSSTLWNFLLTEIWVFGDRREQRDRAGWLGRMLMFFVMNNLALALRGPMIYGLTSYAGVHYLLSNLISLVALMGIRYAFADNLIWKRQKRVQGQEPMFYYSIHNIITVASEVWLPELERFMAAEPIAAPTINVRIGKPGAGRATPANGSGERHIHYREGIGSLGFGIDVMLGERIEIVATPLLRRSPHVLYTNVVEPILRWTFVSMGYALVHGACLAYEDKAYLVTARTDTGKTTTVLRILSQQRRASDKGSFISDDLTLVAPDGRVMTYPKPLTISHHTVRAVNTAVLTRREQLGLLFQSRIHSRSGRQIAFQLTQTKLPVATINAIVQWIVPPPKYHVQRLVPRAKAAQEARLAGMFIIERGDDGNLVLDEREALDTLMQNCEDAYGFPPYHNIKHFLFEANGQNLQQVERDIVAQALAGRPTTVIRSTTMDWSSRITAMLTSGAPAREQEEQLAALELGGMEPVYTTS